MEIEPRRFGDALNEWFRSLGRNWKPLLLSGLAFHVPVAILVTAAVFLTGAGEFFEIYLDPDLETMPPEQLMAVFAPFLWSMGIWGVLQILGGVLMYLAGSRIVAEDLAGRQPSTGAVIRFAMSRFVVGLSWGLLVFLGGLILIAVTVALGWVLITSFDTNFLSVFGVTTLALTALVVFMWLSISLSLGVQVIALEDAGPSVAVRRSFALVQGRWWATFGYLALAALIASTVSQVVSLVFTPLVFVSIFVPAAFAFAMGISVIVQGLVMASVSAAYGIWYVDLRARREPLAVEQLI